MIEELRQLFENKKKKGLVAPNCEQVLGTNTTRNQFATFWEAHGQDLMIVVAAQVHEYERDNIYTSEEKAAFMKGIAKVGKFFHDCWLEREDARMKEQK